VIALVTNPCSTTISVLTEKRTTVAIEDSPRQATGNVLPDGRASQHRKDDNFIDIRSLNPQQATGNALAYAVQSSSIAAHRRQV
jgi:hypothetical protein